MILFFVRNSNNIISDQDEPATSLPWKIARDDDPVLSGGQDAMISDRGDAEDEDVETPVRRGGVMFQVGEIDDEKEEDQEYKKKRTSGSRKKDRHHAEVSLEMRRRQGSELHDKIADNVVYEEDDVENLKEGDLEDIAGHRFEKSKGLSKHKITHGHHKPHTIRVGLNEVKDPKDMKMVSGLGYGFRTELDHSPHELFVEMDELEGEEWVERSR